MHSTNSDKSERDLRLDELATAYLKELELGQKPAQAEWLARYPDLADELAGFFAAMEHVDQIAAPLRVSSGSDAPTLAPNPSSPSSSVNSVRYFGDYELLQEIARGGMGVVYKAKQVSLNRPVALKMILAGQLASTADVQRFRTEAEAAANLDHPNIVPIYEVGEHESQHFFSMKLIEGDSLGHWIADFRLRIAAFTHTHQANAARLIGIVARAIHHAHQRGILHRDLKPANILLEDLDPKGGISNLKSAIPLVTDFGLAKRLEGDKGLTQSGAIVGTPSYMAPEQASGKKGLSIQADVYSLGAVLYELLTGQPPFKADTPLDTVLQVLEREPARPRSLNSKISGDLETICLKCLDKDPERRYRSAEALAEDLDCWLRGEPIRARPAGKVERLWRWARRNPERMTFAGIGATLLMLICAAVFLGYRTTTAAQEQSIEHLYSAHMNLGQQALETGKQTRLMGLLQPYVPWPGQPDRRGWEWHYLRARCPIDLDEHLGYQVRDTSAWSPDGRWLAWGAEDGTTRVWDVSTGQVILSEEALMYRHSGVRSLAWSPDSQSLASSMVGEKEIKIWEISTGQPPRVLTGHADEVLALSWSHDWRLASLDKSYTIILWDLHDETHRTIRANTSQLDAYSFVTMHWRPEQNELVTSVQMVGSETRFWDLNTLKNTRSLPISVHSWSPDGQRFAQPTGIYDSSGKLVRSLGSLQHVYRIIWSPDGQKLAVSDGAMSIKILDANSLQETHSFHGRTEPLVWSPESKRFAVGGTIWDLTPREPHITLGAHNSANSSNQVICLAWSTTGRQLAWATRSGAMEVWDLATKRMIHKVPGSHSKLAWSPDCRYLASIDGPGPRRVTVWDVQSWQSVATLSGLTSTWGFKLEWSEDSKWLVAAHGNTFKLWETQTWQEQPMPATLAEHFMGQDSFLGWGDGKQLMILQPSGLYLWDPSTGKPPRVRYQDFRPPHLASSTYDGQRVVYPSSSSGELTIYEWSSRSNLLLRGHTDRVREAVWSPDLKRVASTSADDSLKIWDAFSGQELLSFRAEQGTGGFHALAFSPDGRQLAAGRGDHSIVIWDASHARLTLPDPELVVRFQWVPQSDRDASETLHIISYCTLAAAVMFCIPGWLLWWALRAFQHGWLRYLAILAILGLAIAAYFFFIDTSRMGFFGIDKLPGSWKLNAEGRWAYVPHRHIYYVPFVGMPFVALAVLLVEAMVRRRWWALGSLIAILTVASLSPMIVVLWINPGLMNPLQHYSWERWYFTALVGAWLTGIMMFLSRLISMAIRARRRKVAGSATAAG